MEGRRNCVIVINNMLSHIPKTESAFIKALEWNREDASYKAPEESIQWERTQHTLMTYMPEPTEDWEIKVLSIFTALSIKKVEEMLIKDREYKNTLKYYIIMYGMGGGFNQRYHEVVKAKNLEEASDLAYEMACEEYGCYSGSHGISSLSEIAEENDLDPIDDNDEIDEIYNEEREGWIDHWAKPYTDELAKSLEYKHYENPYEDDLDFLAEYGE